MPGDCSGAYQYLLNGEPTAIEESWSQRQSAAGDTLVSSSRRAPGVEITVEARLRLGLVSDFSVCWSGAARVEAEYRVQGSQLQVSRCQDGGPREQQAIALAPAGITLMSPLMRIFTGPVIAALLREGGEGTVVVPAIADPADTSTLLQPRLGPRRARLLASDQPLQLAGGEFSCQLCEYSGDQYGPGTQFWLGQDGMLLRYQWQQSPQMLWQVSLLPA